MTKQLVKPGYEYGLTFGKGDDAIGGEHGADFDTPLFTPITALLPGTITGIQTNVDYGLTVTWKLDTPHNGVPHMYNLHLAAFAPGIQIERHIDAGTVIGYSGGLRQPVWPVTLLRLPMHYLQDCQTILMVPIRQKAHT
jgi:hypothetical protein